MNQLYPTDLRAAGIGGRALARFVVQTDGTTTDIEIVASSGYDSLDRATVEVVRRMSWRPATRNGMPENQLVELPIQWTA